MLACTGAACDSQFQQRSIWDGLSRRLARQVPGLRRREAVSAYLKLATACSACGHELGQYRADDGPAYFTILIVGHLMIGPLLFGIRAHVAGCLGLGDRPALHRRLALFLLPRVKGAFVGVQWAVGDRSGRAV